VARDAGDFVELALLTPCGEHGEGVQSPTCGSVFQAVAMETCFDNRQYKNPQNPWNLPSPPLTICSVWTYLERAEATLRVVRCLSSRSIEMICRAECVEITRAPCPSIGAWGAVSPESKDAQTLTSCARR